jgi:hypothetical protein
MSSIPSPEEILTDCWARMGGLKLFLQQLGMQTSKNITTMAGRTTTTSRPYFAFVWKEQYQLHSLTYQGWFTTVRLRSMVICMASWRMISGQQGQSIVSTCLWKHAKEIPVLIVTEPIWFFCTDTSSKGIGATEKGRKHWHNRQLSGGCA